MPENKDYLKFYQEFVTTDEYKAVQKYFNISKCVDYKQVGHMTYLFRNSKTKTFNEWYIYYHNSKHSDGLKWSVSRLQVVLKANKIYYSDDIVLECIKALMLYQTWIGVQQERELMKLLADSNFYCLYAPTDVDLNCNVDIILVSRKIKKWCIGIQVKPSSFFETDYTRSKTIKFFDRYHLPTVTVKYDKDTKEFIKADLKNIECMKKLLLRYEKASC